MAECHYGCGASEDLRPYGPDGAWVCYPCASSSTERRQATERAMAAVIGAAAAASPVGSVVFQNDRPPEPLMPEDVGRPDLAVVGRLREDL